MKYLFLLIFGGALNLFAQTISPNTLSSKPTLQELKTAFGNISQLQKDPIALLGIIADKKDDAVPGLTGIAFDSTVDEQGKIFTVLALESINSQSAYGVISSIVSLNQNTEVKGTALRALSNSYNRMTIEKNLIPNKEIIHVLLINCDDTTMVLQCNKRMGTIAREGLNNWIGFDFGDLTLESRIVTVGKNNNKMSLIEYRSWWWNKFKDKIMWDKNILQFVLSR